MSAFITCSRMMHTLQIGSSCDTTAPANRSGWVGLKRAAFVAAMPRNLRCLAHEAVASFSCESDGAHGVLLSHGIQALTIGSSGERGTRKIEQDAASIVEQLFVVVNNLSQHFNQCFYYYLFTRCGYAASNTFAPLQLYIAPVLALLLYLWAAAVGLFYAAPGTTQASGCKPSAPSDRAHPPKTESAPGSKSPASGRAAGVVLLTVYALTAATLSAPALLGPTVHAHLVPWYHATVPLRPRSDDAWIASAARLVAPHTASFLCCLLGAGLWYCAHIVTSMLHRLPCCVFADIALSDWPTLAEHGGMRVMAVAEAV
eukprot:m.976364 g.976364  ORF g.976364 m.976364 type:complete len:315 (+) comp23945_c2_seq23:279-1223(+)